MNILDILSPLIRRTGLFATLFLFGFLVVFGSSQLVNNKYKATLYFSVQPINTDLPANNHYYATEGTERMAEAMSGWIKNPSFRETIQGKAGTSIEGFRKKISARKQNRMNVFVNVTLHESQSELGPTIAQAAFEAYDERLADMNITSAAAFSLVDPTITSESRIFPLWWFAIGAIIIGLTFAIIGVYLIEALRDKVSFLQQIRSIFPESPLLRIHQKIGKHDSEFLEHFILSLESPQLLGTFPKAYEHFSLQDNYGLNPAENTPVILVQMGVTTVRELENMKALFDEDIALIVFEK